MDLLKPVLVLGIVQAGMYGMLPVAVILSYRINRTIAFVHGGIAMSAGLIYWILVFDNPIVPGSRPGFDPKVGLLLTVAAGTILGAMYGAVVMSRWVAGQNRMTLTVVSMAGMMLAVGIFTSTLKVPAECGTKQARIGTAVYGVSGAIAALAGALIAAMVGPDVPGMFTLFLRGLALAVVGGLTSLPIALCGALLFGILETALVVDLVGHVSPGRQKLIINCALLAAILLVARTRRDSFYLLERQAL